MVIFSALFVCVCVCVCVCVFVLPIWMQSNKAHGATRVLRAYLQVWKEKVGVGVCLLITRE